MALSEVIGGCPTISATRINFTLRQDPPLSYNPLCLYGFLFRKLSRRSLRRQYKFDLTINSHELIEHEFDNELIPPSFSSTIHFAFTVSTVSSNRLFTLNQHDYGHPRFGESSLSLVV